MAVDLEQPLDAYKIYLKDKHHDNTVKYFEELTRESKIDIASNQKIVKEYNETVKLLEQNNKSSRKYKALKILLIILIIAMFVGGIIMIYCGATDKLSKGLGIGVGIALIILPIIIIVLLATIIRKKLKELKDIIDKLQAKADKLLKEAWKSMESLNNLYDWNIPAYITNKDTDLIVLDKNFNAKRFKYLHDLYGFDSIDDETSSTVMVQSGEILGNPFVICKDFSQDWHDVTYQGSIIIHWTETVHTKDGTRIEHRSQTLIATITKPAPYYNYDTYVVYGNDACPNLSFRRQPSSGADLDDKKLEKYVSKKSKQLDKKEKHDLMDNDDKTNFQKMGNDEFEALFGATNRDNEVEFRLLFTPLAQRNMIKLIRSKEPYGDDFYFTQDKKINYIQSLHSQSFNYRADPEVFIDYDYERAKKNFIAYNDNFFKSFFFDLAPLLSIPLYQQNKSRDYIYKNDYFANTTSYEQEVLANQYDKSIFKHQECATDTILKAHFNSKAGDVDNITIRSHGFKKVKHLDMVPKLGGDGRMHSVPVEWYEYLPVYKDTPISVTEKNSTRSGFANLVNSPQFQKIMSTISKNGPCHFERGLFTYIGATLATSQANNLNNLFGNVATDARLEQILKVERAVNEGVKQENKLNEASNNQTEEKIEAVDQKENKKGSND